MNSRTPTPTQWQLLSNYLDGSLSAREQAEVETLLKRDPQAAAELEALRQLRSLLRNLPQRRVPHNFTLTRSMAQAQKAPPILPWLRLSSILAALLMVFLFSLDLLPATTTARQTDSSAYEMEAFSAPGSETRPTLPPIIYWNGQPAGQRALSAPQGMGGGAAEDMNTTSKYGVESLPFDPNQPVITQPVPLLPQSSSTPTIVAPHSTPMPAPPLPQGAQPVLGLRPEEGGQVLNTNPIETTTFTAAPPPLQQPTLRQWAALAAGSLAILLGLLTLWLKKRRPG